MPAHPVLVISNESEKKEILNGLGSPGFHVVRWNRSVQTSCPAPPGATLAPAPPGQSAPAPSRLRIWYRPPTPALQVRVQTLAHLRSAFSSGLRCVRRCRLRAWGGPPLAASGLDPRWPGTMSCRARPAGAAAAAAGLPDSSSTLGAPAAGLCAVATTTMTRYSLRQCAPPPPAAGPAAPSLSTVVALRDWPALCDARPLSAPTGPRYARGAGPERPAWRPLSRAGGKGDVGWGAGRGGGREPLGAGAPGGGAGREAGDSPGPVRKGPKLAEFPQQTVFPA